MKKYCLLVLASCSAYAMQSSRDTKLAIAQEILQRCNQMHSRYENTLQGDTALENDRQDLALELSDNVTQLKEMIAFDDVPFYFLDQLAPVACKASSLSLVKLLIYKGIPCERFLNYLDQENCFKDGHKMIINHASLVKSDVDAFIKEPVRFVSDHLSTLSLLRQLYYGTSYGCTSRRTFVSTCMQLVGSNKSDEVVKFIEKLEKEETNKDRRTMLMACKLLQAKATQPREWKL